MTNNCKPHEQSQTKSNPDHQNHNREPPMNKTSFPENIRPAKADDEQGEARLPYIPVNQHNRVNAHPLTAKHNINQSPLHTWCAHPLTNHHHHVPISRAPPRRGPKKQETQNQ